MNKTIYKIIIPLIVFVLSAILLTVGLCGFFGKAGNGGHIAEVTDGSGNEILTDGTAQAMPERMVFGVRALAATAPVAETVTSVTLKATITPENADDKAVDWWAAWKNPASDWAIGKDVSEYMTVTPQTDGALTATVSCKKAFGEQIKIKVVSRDNPAVSAECVCDYVRRVTDMTVSLQEGTNETTVIELESGKEYSAIYTPQFGEGTVSAQAACISRKIQMTDEFVAAIHAYNQYMSTTVTASAVDANSFTANRSFMYELGGNSQAIHTSLNTIYASGVRDAIKKVSSAHATVTIEIAIRYGDVVSDTMTKTLPVKFNDDAMAVRVQSVELNRSTLAM